MTTIPLSPSLQPADALLDKLAQDDGWRVLARAVTNPRGSLGAILRRDTMIVFAHMLTVEDVHAAPSLGARARQSARRCAVSWMSTNPALQRNVQRYRFDVMLTSTDGTLARIIPDAF